MKRFLEYIFFIAAAVWALLYLSNCIYMKHLRRSNAAYYEMPYDIEVAAVGNSHTVFGIDFSKTKFADSSFNYSFVSQSPVYDEMLVEYYKDHFADNAVLFIDVSYCSLWGNELAGDDFESKNEQYFPILDHSHMRFKTEKDSVIGRFPILIFLPKNLVYSVFSPRATQDGAEEDSIEKESLSERGRLRAQSHLNDSYYAGNVLPFDRSSIHAIDDLVHICRQNSIRPILITTPYMHYYYDYFPKEVLEKFYLQMETYIDKDDVEYWDYSHDCEFAYDDTLFSDTDHLNLKGANKFTEELLFRMERNQ